VQTDPIFVRICDQVVKLKEKLTKLDFRIRIQPDPFTVQAPMLLLQVVLQELGLPSVEDFSRSMFSMIYERVLVRIILPLSYRFMLYSA
jgi:hypothetical protein